MEKIVRVKADAAHDVCPWPPYIAKVSLKRRARMMTHGDDEKNGDCRKIRSLLYAYRHK